MPKATMAAPRSSTMYGLTTVSSSPAPELVEGRLRAWHAYATGGGSVGSGVGRLGAYRSSGSASMRCESQSSISDSSQATARLPMRRGRGNSPLPIEA